MQTSEFLSIFDYLNSLLGDPTGVGGLISEGMKIIAAITFLFTALQCFLGYKLFKFWVAVCGFFTFGILGGVVSSTISGNAGMTAFIAILSALLGAFIAFKLYKVGVFILCGFMGFLLGYVLTRTVVLGIIMALILGVLSLFFVKPVIIISTSISGGLVAGTSLTRVLGIDSFATSIIIGVLFAIFGMLVQFATNKKTSNINQGNQQNNINQQINETQGETVNNFSNTQVKLDDTINHFSEKTSRIVSSMKDSSMKSSSDFFAKVKNKIDIENSIVMKKAKGLTLDEVAVNLEEALYSIKTLQYIMPFVEYILYFVSLIAIIYPFFMFNYLIDGNIALLLVIGILCFAKKKYNAIAIAFSLVTISKLVMIIKLIRLPYSVYNFSTVLIDTAITGYISFIALKYFLESESAISFKNRLADLFKRQTINENNQTTIPHPENEVKGTVNCSNCGEMNKITDNFCKRCGVRLTEETKEILAEDAEVTTL